jgi:ubiquinone/menaquinone biosynthesis C-methylase UbiE
MAYRESAAFYDAIYSFKDYAAESERVHELVVARKPDARTLLDVATGTGKHLEHLRRRFEVEGLDLSAQQLAIARERLGPDAPLHEGDMTSFELGRRFDAVTCLFSSIGMVRELEAMQRAVATMARHLEPGGVLLVEPWLEPAAWKPGHLHLLTVDEPELKIARTTIAGPETDVSIMDMHHLVVTPAGAEYFVEHHELGLWTAEQQLDAFRAAGLEAEHDPEGLIGRGLFVGVKR